MKNKCITICRLSILIILLFSCKKGQTENNRNALIEYEEQVKIKIDKITSENINKRVDIQEFYWGLDSLNKFNIKTLIDQHKFFFYFSYQTCSPCIQQTVEYIKEIYPDYENDDRIIFISPDYPVRFRRNCYGKKLLTLSNGELGIPLETENVPFIFTLNSDLVIEKLHIVNKNDFAKTSEFLKLMN